ncbi:DUF300-domain-containing protein, partial [Corynespora cassiicola Philippines]
GLTVHGVLITISASCTLIACSLSFYLIYRHLTNYTQPKLQKLIIRILFMVPIYSIACLLSIPFYKAHVYIASIYEFYESLVIASFFLLLCRYLHLDLPSLRRAFSLLIPKPWIYPIRFFRMYIFRRKTAHTVDGLRWFSIIWAAVFQFCIVKFLGALVKCITEATNVYCKESNSIHHARIWVQILEILSLVTAMLCLLQFYSQTKSFLAPHQPLLKFVAIKLVVFLFYVQSFTISLLTKSSGPLSPTPQISYPSLTVGIPNTLLCVEMAAVSILHLWAYPWKAHRDTSSAKPMADGGETSSSEALRVESEMEEGGYEESGKGRARGWKAAVGHVVSFGDVWRGVVEGGRGLSGRRRGGMGAVGLAGEEGEVLRTGSLGEALRAVGGRGDVHL